MSLEKAGVTPSPSPEIELPSAIRIRQRLGQVSTERAFRHKVVPHLAELGGQTMPAETFIDKLESELTIYADKHVIGMVPFVLSGMMPRIIDSVIDNDGQKESAFSAWESRMEELKTIDEEAARTTSRRYTQRSPKVPRKQKKRQQRNGVVNIDPSRWHR